MKNQISQTLMLEAIKDPGILYRSPEDVVKDARLELIHKKKMSYIYTLQHFISCRRRV